MRLPLNCLLVAAWLWGMSRARSWLAVKRSVSLWGLVPHFSVVRDHGRRLTVIEYIPRRRKHAFSDRMGQSFMLFDGLYRVREYRMVGMGTGDTLRDALSSVVRKNDKGTTC